MLYYRAVDPSMAELFTGGNFAAAQQFGHQLGEFLSEIGAEKMRPAKWGGWGRKTGKVENWTLLAV